MRAHAALAEALTAPFALRLLRLVPHFRPAVRPTPSALARARYPRLHRWLVHACQRPSVAASYHHDLVVKIYAPSVPKWQGDTVPRGGRKKRAKAALNSLFGKGGYINTQTIFLDTYTSVCCVYPLEYICKCTQIENIRTHNLARGG